MEDVNNLQILSLGIFFTALFGLMLYIFGDKLQKYSRWIFFLVLAFFSGVVFYVAAGQEPTFAPVSWARGWVLPRDVAGAITVGLWVDAFTFVGLALALLLTALLGGFLSLAPKTIVWVRIVPAFLMSIAGFSICVTALTPWMVFIGLFLIILGGTVVLGATWKSNEDATLGIRFALERSSGLFCSIFGACILASSNSSLLLNQQSGSLEPLGAALLLLGFFFQFQSFPFSARRFSQAQVPLAVSVFISQILPGWAALFFLVRLEASLKGSGILWAYGWLCLLSAVLSTGEGLFQTRSTKGIAVWISAGFAFASALFAFAGAQAGFVWGIGVGLSGLSLSLLIGEQGRQEKAKKTGNKKDKIEASTRARFTVSRFFACAAGTGLLGFVSSIGGFHGFIHGLESAPVVVCYSIAIFLLVLLGWKNFFQLNRDTTVTELSLVQVIFSALLVVLSLSFVWDGSLFGGVVLDRADQLVPSVLKKVFSQVQNNTQRSESDLIALGGYWGMFFLAFLAAYWGFGRKKEVLVSFSNKFSRIFGVVEEGYGVDRAFLGALRLISYAGEQVYRIVDQRIWDRLLPNGLTRVIEKGSQAATLMDLRFFARLSGILRSGVEIPAKSLQLIQNGNVQWYLFFAVASGIALLLNFLKG